MASQRSERAKRAFQLTVESMEDRALCSVTVVVPGTANPYFADKSNTNGGGTPPPPIDVTGDSLLTFAVTGGTNQGPGYSTPSPDGGAIVTARAGPRGAVSTWTLPIDSLVGIFEGATLGAAPAPYTGSLAATDLAPLLGQVFPIGDGLTGAGTGSPQVFHVPAGATKLYLANVDAYQWGNDGGKFSVTVTQTSPAVAIDASLQGIHRLIYPGQTLAVPIVVTNTGTAAITGFVNVNLYLSMNNNPAARGTATKTYLGQSLNIAAGNSQTITLPLTVPGTQAVGTYYIKAVITSGSVVPNFLKNGDFIAVSPALTEIDTAPNMFAVDQTTNYSRSGVYEAAVGLAKSLPNYGFTLFLNNYSTTNIQNYIKSNEGWEDGPYLDTNPQHLPTIGWGFNLAANTAISQAQLTALDNATKLANKGVGLIDPTTNKPFDTENNGNILTGFINVATANGVIGPNNPLKYHITGFSQTAPAVTGWFNQLYNNVFYPNTEAALYVSYGITLSNLPGNVQAVLLDMSYNIGTGYINGVNRFSSMLTYISIANFNSLNYANAAFELLNSSYGTEFPVSGNNYGASRAVKNFRLLVSGNEQYL